VETYTLDPRCWRIGLIFSSNPLIRNSDRIEVLVTCAAVMVFLISVPLASIAGAVVYEMRHSLYAQEAQVRHKVVATVVGTAAGGADPAAVQASWPGAGAEHTGPVRLTGPAKVGDRVQIWVNPDGNPVAAPTPTWHAVADAVATIEAALLISGFGIATLVTGVRSRLDRARGAEWEREIRCSEEDEGRTNQR
jgi:hypothetical protein